MWNSNMTAAAAVFYDVSSNENLTLDKNELKEPLWCSDIQCVVLVVLLLYMAGCMRVGVSM